MILRDMTRAECEAALSTNFIGHLGCISGNRPYVVPNTRRVAVVENLRIDDQLSRFAVRPLEIDFVGLYPRASGRGRLQEGGELGHCPFAVSK
ncbi:hypothetical protein GR138_26155 [Shinella kummerowiae]|jgi:hypothetical protein|uniref:Uncharacterized protein n=1 Tax=Shinella kummerowiae TaxID=417745 RepID=A0A6N8SIV8_9HYPH|nr:hypothetical protein [Shinella kummerowiae]MXN48691.1 hypothetical protein [Shinella kummerowiae]